MRSLFLPLNIIFTFCFISNLYAQPHLHTLNSLLQNAVKINGSTVDDFHEGYAIIRKGENFALINQQGGFLAPYGKYKFNKFRAFEIDTRKCGFSNGMCAVRDPDSELYGFIDLTGNLVVPCTLNDVLPFRSDGYAWAKQKDSNGKEEQIFIDKKGQKYKLKNQSLYNPDLLEAYPVAGINGFQEFYNKKGTLLFKTKRFYRDGFSEGLIKVDTTTEMAGTKTGYMNINGKMTIPYRFKGKNYTFRSGLALWIPPTSDEFKYIYINPKGEEVIKLRSTSDFRDIHFYNSEFEGDYTTGSAQGGTILLDKKGNMSFLKPAIENNNPEFTAAYTGFKVDGGSIRRSGNFLHFQVKLTYEVDEKFVSGGLNGGKTITSKATKFATKEGIADLSGKIIIPPIYWKAGFPDPVSGLSKVVYTMQVEEREIDITGYASKSNHFAIVIMQK